MGFVYGVKQEGVCGVGMLLKINSKFEFKCYMRAGRGTNSRAELLALWGILFIAKKWMIKDNLIVADSQVMISWAMGVENLQSLLLAPWMMKVRALILNFSGILFWHIYRECNCIVDRLSKQGIWEMDGYIHYEVWRNISLARSCKLGFT